MWRWQKHAEKEDDASSSVSSSKPVMKSALDNVRSTNDIWDWDVQEITAPGLDDDADFDGASP